MCPRSLLPHNLNPARPQDICESQEAWWLRKGCRRARCRLIKGLADAFGIPVKSVQVLLYFSLEHVLHGEGLLERAPEGVQQVSCSAGWRDGDGVLHHGVLPGRGGFLIYFRPAQDIQSHKDGELATFTSDTVEHDILPLEGGQVTHNAKKNACVLPNVG